MALYEEVKVINAFLPASYAAGTNYNGAASGAVGIDMRGFDEATIIVHAGTVTGSGTLDITPMQNTTNTTVGVAVVPNVAGTTQAFPQIVAANDETVYIGRLQAKNMNRYLFIRAVGATAASVFGITVILSKAAQMPVSQVNAVSFIHQ